VADIGEDKPAPAPAASPAAGQNEAFLSRWSRLKQDARERPVAPPRSRNESPDPNSPAPELPPLEQLTFDSDYRQFFHPKVNEDLRRAALKKLFSDPSFNVMDGLDTYIDDYSKTEPIPAAMLAGLKQAQNILKWAKGEEDDGPGKDLTEKEQPLPVADATQVALEQPARQSPFSAAVGTPAPGSPAVSSGDASGPGRS
jgi:hypothetical protein